VSGIAFHFEKPFNLKRAFEHLFLPGWFDFDIAQGKEIQQIRRLGLFCPTN
jgi:hypothetical protein